MKNQEWAKEPMWKIDELSCRFKNCSYFRHYLALLDACRVPMSHDMFHAKELKLLSLQWQWEKWNAERGTFDGFSFAALCKRLEKECCV